LDDLCAGRLAKGLVMQFTGSVSPLSITRHDEVAPLVLTIKIRGQRDTDCQKISEMAAIPFRGIIANPQVCSSYRQFLLAITLRIKKQRRKK